MKATRHLNNSAMTSNIPWLNASYTLLRAYAVEPAAAVLSDRLSVFYVRRSNERVEDMEKRKTGKPISDIVYGSVKRPETNPALLSFFEPFRFSIECSGRWSCGLPRKYSFSFSYSVGSAISQDRRLIKSLCIQMNCVKVPENKSVFCDATSVH